MIIAHINTNWSR